MCSAEPYCICCYSLYILYVSSSLCKEAISCLMENFKLFLILVILAVIQLSWVCRAILWTKFMKIKYRYNRRQDKTNIQRWNVTWTVGPCFQTNHVQNKRHIQMSIKI